MNGHPFCPTDSLVGLVAVMWMSISCKCLSSVAPNRILAPNLTLRNYYCKMEQTTGVVHDGAESVALYDCAPLAGNETTTTS